jgi:hypothetical protein
MARCPSASRPFAGDVMWSSTNESIYEGEAGLRSCLVCSGLKACAVVSHLYTRRKLEKLESRVGNTMPSTKVPHW